MAQVNRQAAAMSPEEKVAARLVQRLGVTPPIAINAVLALYADIEFDNIPGDSDAVLVRAAAGRTRPLVILDRDRPETRRRFTQAHELGHILIPWHIGTISCHMSLNDALGEYLYRTTEAEANRFAAEFLLPSEWMRGVVEANDRIEDIFTTILTSNVSTVSACISLCKVLPAGYVFAACNQLGEVVASGTSANTAAPIMGRGTTFRPNFYAAAGGSGYRFDAKRTTVHWWRFQSEAMTAPSGDTRTSRELLVLILSDCVPVEKRDSLSGEINGIIGAANNSFRPGSTGEFVTVMKQRFLNRQGEQKLCAAHPDFELFLWRKAEEVLAKRSLRRD